MLDLNKPDVGCLISTCPMSDLYKSDFNRSDVGFLQVECRIFKVGCRMAPISFRIMQLFEM